MQVLKVGDKVVSVNNQLLSAPNGTGFTILNKSSEVTSTWDDNVSWKIKDFWRWGAVCVFTLQFICNTAIESTYGFIFATLPYRAVSRVWINNSNQFYIDGNGNTVRRNSSSISTGAYILTGFYLTNDAE